MQSLMSCLKHFYSKNKLINIFLKPNFLKMNEVFWNTGSDGTPKTPQLHLASPLATQRNAQR